ncbi:MAG: tripartite tricarboxylate transporter substrate binding protein, partial [Rubrivivax sp.]|nr:tripartite tricarboxylate transporter substrate binding protein [Rubrivivax sp.]
TTRRHLVTALAAAAASTAWPARAQAWPTRPVRIVLQFPPGGSTDAVARILAEPLSAALGQPVLVENRPGADGAIAGDLVARSAPDGHTFFLASNTPMMQVPLLKKTPPYDPVKSFTPVTLVGRYIYVLVTSPSLPARDVPELLAHARANPGKLGYGSYSGVTQLMHTQLKMARAETTLVPYKGEGPTITDILGNHVQMTFATPASTLQHVREGKLRAMAVLLPQRWSQLPQVPTAAEAGLPPLNAGTWAALFGPARLPADVTQRMNRELGAVMARPDVREKITALGFELAGSSPDELGVFVQDQLQAWAKAFRDAGMQPE